jgi:hypothetical protein
VYQSTLYPAGVAVLAVAAGIAVAVALWRYGRSTRRSLTSTRTHARAVRRRSSLPVVPSPCWTSRNSPRSSRPSAPTWPAVTCLAELAADDAAARSAGRRVLATALVAIATGTGILSGAVPGNSLPGLAAAAYAVPARVERLLGQPRPGTTVMVGLALALMSAALILLPALLAVVTGGN